MLGSMEQYIQSMHWQLIKHSRHYIYSNTHVSQPRHRCVVGLPSLQGSVRITAWTDE